MKDVQCEHLLNPGMRHTAVYMTTAAILHHPGEIIHWISFSFEWFVIWILSLVTCVWMMSKSSYVIELVLYTL